MEKIKKDELNMIREWFNVCQDSTHRAYLTKKDYQLAIKIYKQLGFRVTKEMKNAISSQQSTN